MKVFISWSGARSQTVAESLRDWLQSVIQAVEPWMSAADIDKGARWSSEIAARLEETRFGIICLTHENVEAPWIMFEAGALSKTLDRTFVCPYLFDLEPADLKGPLVQFQAAKAQRQDTRKLVETVNRALATSALPQDKLERAFDIWWPELELRLKAVPNAGERVGPERPEREILEEILELVRAEARESRSFAELRNNFMSVWSRLVESSLPADPNVTPDVRKALMEFDRAMTGKGRGNNDDFPDYLKDSIASGEVVIDEEAKTARILIDVLGSDLSDNDPGSRVGPILARTKKLLGLRARLEHLGYKVEHQT